jgi:hypothetical protein
VTELIISVIVSFKQNCGYSHEEKQILQLYVHLKYTFTGSFEENISISLKFCMSVKGECGAVVEYRATDPKVSGSNLPCSTYFNPCNQTILEENTH